MEAIQKQLKHHHQLLMNLVGKKKRATRPPRRVRSMQTRTRNFPRRPRNSKKNSRRRRDDEMVFQQNRINTQSFFRNKGNKTRTQAHVNVKTPSANHQNQTRKFQQKTLEFVNSNFFRPQRQRKMKRQVTPHADAPPNMEMGDEFDINDLKGKRYPVSTTLASKLGAGLITDDALKRTLLYEKSMIDFTHNLATGWYAAIRKACIRFGPPAINDKYFVDQAYRQTSGVAPINLSNLRYQTYVSAHMMMINFLQNLLIANFNYLIQNDIQKLLTRLPQHIAFSLTVAARKFVIRVRNGVTNIATRLPHLVFKQDVFDSASDTGSNPCYYTSATSNLEMVFYPPQVWLGAEGGGTANVDEVPGLVNYLFAVQQHEQYPFTTVDEVQSKLPGLTYYTSEGVAAPVTLDISEIVSVYGYSAYPGASTYAGCYIHDLSGLEQTKISGIFRSMFFAQLTFDNESEYGLIPDEFNDRLNTNYYYDNYKMAIYFGLTGNIPNVDYMLTANMPFAYAREDITDDGDPSNNVRVSSTSKGLSYLITKYNSNDTRPSPYKATTRSLPVFPSVNFSPHAYNLAIAMAQKMQNRYYDFVASPFPLTTTELFTISSDDPNVQNNLSPLLTTQRSYYTVLYEVLLNTGVWVIQYDGRFVLPSPIIEDFKPYNSYNTWTYKGSQQSVGIQLNQGSLGGGRGILPNIAPQDVSFTGIPYNFGNWYIKPGVNYSKTFSIRDIAKGQELANIYMIYDGQTYSPINFDIILDDHSKAMNEIRPYVKLNNCPEYETSLPSMHTLYVTGGESGPYSSFQIYTPLSMDDYTKKNVAIFLKVALLPYLQVPTNINIPMLNCTNVASNYFGSENVLFQPKTLFNLYQYSFVANYTGESSELDYYYAQLRKHFVGSWSDLLPMFTEAASAFLGSDTGMNMVMNMIPKKKGKGKKAPSANGDIMGMLNTILGSIGNLDENGSVSVNTPKSQSSGSDIWSTLGDVALKAAPLLLEML